MTIPITVAFIGAGYTATEHLKAFSGLPGVRIGGIFSRTESKAQLLAEKYKTNSYGSIADLYEQTKANLVVVTVPELEMARCAISCFHYDWSVLLEKPAGFDIADATRIRDAALAWGGNCYVALNRRAYSSAKEVLHQLDIDPSPRFIKVLDQQDPVAAVAVHNHPQIVADNFMFANSIHVIDYFRVFGRGEVNQVVPVVKWNREQPGLVISKIEFTSGDVGLYEGIWNGPGPWAVSVSLPSRRFEMQPLEQGSVQLHGSRVKSFFEISKDDTEYKPGFRQQAIEAVSAARNQSHLLPTIDDSFLTMKLVADIFGLHN